MHEKEKEQGVETRGEQDDTTKIKEKKKHNSQPATTIKVKVCKKNIIKIKIKNNSSNAADDAIQPTSGAALLPLFRENG